MVSGTGYKREAQSSRQNDLLVGANRQAITIGANGIEVFIVYSLAMVIITWGMGMGISRYLLHLHPRSPVTYTASTA